MQSGSTSTPASSTEQLDVQAAFAAPLMQMMTGYWISQGIYAVAKLGIPDLLKDGPKTADAMAGELNAHPDFLYRLLRALASIGVFSETTPKTFELTPRGHLLRSDVPHTMRPVALMIGGEHYEAWGHLAEGVLSGQTPFEATYGMGVFEYFEKNPQASEIFNAAMTALVKNDHAVVASHYDFRPFRKIVDIGGGHGLLLATILKKNPHLSGVVFDLPHVVSGAESYLKQEAVSERCVTVSGDFFHSVPEGGDVYILSHIIHDWRDESSIKILKNIHHVLPSHGKVLLVETVITSGDDSAAGKWMDLNMLVMTPGGRERTEEEFSQLFEQSGFRLNQIIPTPKGISIIEGVKKS